MGALAANLLLTNTSIAGPGKGALVFNDAYCFGDPDTGSTYCYSNMGVVKETITPSNKVIFMGNGRSDYSEIDESGNVVYEDSIKYLTQGFQTVEGVLKEFGQFFSTSITVNGLTFCSRYAFHQSAKGNLQFERSDLPCN